MDWHSMSLVHALLCFLVRYGLPLQPLGRWRESCCERGCLAKRPSTLCTLFCALEIGLGSVKTCLEPKPKENGGRRRIILQGNQQGWLPRHCKRCYYCPTVTLRIRGLILVGSLSSSDGSHWISNVSDVPYTTASSSIDK